MSVELTPEEHAAIERRIDCPVPWCRGGWLEHGGDGLPPEQWLHEEDHGHDLGHDAWIGRSQQGAGPIEWSFVMDRHNITDAHDPHDLSAMLRSVADAIDAIAKQEP